MANITAETYLVDTVRISVKALDAFAAGLPQPVPAVVNVAKILVELCHVSLNKQIVGLWELTDLWVLDCPSQQNRLSSLARARSQTPPGIHPVDRKFASFEGRRPTRCEYT